VQKAGLYPERLPDPGPIVNPFAQQPAVEFEDRHPQAKADGQVRIVIHIQDLEPLDARAEIERQFEQEL
jgi:hypothetical protein